MKYNYNECTTKALEEEQERIAEQYHTITEEIKKRKQEEAEKKKAQLALEKQKREAEIRAAKEHYNELVHAFIEDYGYYDDDFWTWFFKR